MLQNKTSVDGELKDVKLALAVAQSQAGRTERQEEDLKRTLQVIWGLYMTLHDTTLVYLPSSSLTLTRTYSHSSIISHCRLYPVSPLPVPPLPLQDKERDVTRLRQKLQVTKHS